MASPLHWIEDITTAVGQWARQLPVIRRMLTGHLVLRIIAYMIPFALATGLIWLAWDGYERIKYANERVTQVDVALKESPPVPDSKYCRRLFGFHPEYAPCYATERSGYVQFKRAWEAGKDLGTIRDQLIRCYLEGRRAEGTSWGAAAHCAEADAPGADTVQ